MDNTPTIEAETFNILYDRFIKEGRHNGFTDAQVDFLWDWIMEISRLPLIKLPD